MQVNAELNDREKALNEYLEDSVGSNIRYIQVERKTVFIKDIFGFEGQWNSQTVLFSEMIHVLFIMLLTSKCQISALASSHIKHFIHVQFFVGKIMFWKSMPAL